jgi:hypothetical protein
MEPAVQVKKKHLLLLNRLMRSELKKDIIPTPSKLTEDDVNKYFKMLFKPLEEEGTTYYMPIKNKVSLNIDESLFKALIKKPKVKAVKTKEDKESEKEMMKEKEKASEMRYITLSVDKIYKDLINPYIAKKKAGEKAEKEEDALLKKFFQVSDDVRNEIKKASPKLYDNLLKPKYDEYRARKENLSIESKQQMKDIRKSAQEEKRKLKQQKIEA